MNNLDHITEPQWRAAEDAAMVYLPGWMGRFHAHNILEAGLSALPELARREYTHDEIERAVNAFYESPWPVERSAAQNKLAAMCAALASLPEQTAPTEPITEAPVRITLADLEAASAKHGIYPGSQAYAATVQIMDELALVARGVKSEAPASVTVEEAFRAGIAYGRASVDDRSILFKEKVAEAIARLTPAPSPLPIKAPTPDTLADEARTAACPGYCIEPTDAMLDAGAAMLDVNDREAREYARGVYWAMENARLAGDAAITAAEREAGE